MDKAKAGAADYTTFHILFERELAQAQYRIPFAMRESMTLAVEHDVIIRQLVLNLKVFVLTQKRTTKKEMTFEVPANWFQMLLRDVLKKKHIKTKTICKTLQFEEKFIFPELPPSMPNIQYVKQNTIHDTETTNKELPKPSGNGTGL